MSHRKQFTAIFISLAAVALCWALRSTNTGANAAPNPEARQEIARLAELMQWKPGTVVADIGAGDGSYSFEAAKIVGSSGRVYATEIDSAKLKELRADAAKRKLANVVVVEGAAGDTKLPSDCCDAIFLRHVYHHITQPQEFDQNLLRSLKPGARLAIIDFPPNNDYGPVAGVPANRGGHGIPQKILVEELTTAGLRVEKTVDHWSGNDYCVIFVKPSQ
ncbi:MAG: methyltransferase domain-containing protein [Candidatus Acidiferrales bacterium]